MIKGVILQEILLWCNYCSYVSAAHCVIHCHFPCDFTGNRSVVWSHIYLQHGTISSTITNIQMPSEAHRLND